MEYTHMCVIIHITDRDRAKREGWTCRDQLSHPLECSSHTHCTTGDREAGRCFISWEFGDGSPALQDRPDRLYNSTDLFLEKSLLVYFRVWAAHWTMKQCNIIFGCVLQDFLQLNFVSQFGYHRSTGDILTCRWRDPAVWSCPILLYFIIDFSWAFSEVPDGRICEGLYVSSFPGFSRVKQKTCSFSIKWTKVCWPKFLTSGETQMVDALMVSSFLFPCQGLGTVTLLIRAALLSIATHYSYSSYSGTAVMNRSIYRSCILYYKFSRGLPELTHT